MFYSDPATLVYFQGCICIEKEIYKHCSVIVKWSVTEEQYELHFLHFKLHKSSINFSATKLKRQINKNGGLSRKACRKQLIKVTSTNFNIPFFFTGLAITCFPFSLTLSTAYELCNPFNLKSIKGQLFLVLFIYVLEIWKRSNRAIRLYSWQLVLLPLLCLTTKASSWQSVYGCFTGLTGCLICNQSSWLHLYPLK